jgi:hypothetical protein
MWHYRIDHRLVIGCGQMARCQIFLEGKSACLICRGARRCQPVGFQRRGDLLDHGFLRRRKPLGLAMHPEGQGRQQFELRLPAEPTDQAGGSDILVALPGVEQRLAALQVKLLPPFR